jgi:hypothetical protein
MHARVAEPHVERKPHEARKLPRRPRRATYLTTSVEIKQSCRRDTLAGLGLLGYMAKRRKQVAA